MRIRSSTPGCNYSRMRAQTGDLLNALCRVSRCEVDEVSSTDSENKVTLVCGINPNY